MAAAALFFLTITAGAAFAAARFRVPFGRGALFSCCGLVLLLYVFSLFGALVWGARLALACAAALWCFSLYSVWRAKDGRAFFARLCNPAFALAALALAACVFGNRGRLVTNWDDLAHWADTVKIMANTGLLGAESGANAAFPAYPPAASLFLYYAEYLHGLLTGGAFSEWLLYAVYPLLLLAPLLPALDACSFKKPLPCLLVMAGVLAMPAVLFRDAYRVLGVDPLLGTLGGAFLFLSLQREASRLGDDALFALLAAVLTLTKQIGILFAAFAVLALCTDTLLLQRTLAAPQGRRLWRGPALSAGAAALCFGSWQWKLAACNANQNFSAPVEWDAVLRVLRGAEGGYRQTAFARFFPALTGRTQPVGPLEIEMSIAALFALLIAGLLLLTLARYMVNKRQDKAAAGLSCCRSCAAAAWGAGLCLVFAFGLLMGYLFKFSETEAVDLSAFTRYLDAPLAVLAALLFLLCADALAAATSVSFRRAGAALLTAGVLFCLPVQEAGALLLRRNVTYSLETRAPYDALAAKMAASTDADARIYMLGGRDDWFDCAALRFALRPRTLISGEAIGTHLSGIVRWPTPADGDALLALLREGKYDALLLYRMDLDCASAFADANPAERALYAPDPQTGLLMPLKAE